jgi:RNA polymerase sigma-70 factor (ECF subfamily)
MPAEPVSPLDSSEKRQLIQQALQALQPAFRAVVVLRLIEGYSTRETADLLNLPLGTVLSRLARAQRKMRDWLLPYIDDEYK